MFERIDLSETTTKEEYKPLYDSLMRRLVVLQQEARQKGIGLVVLFEGWEGAGKGSRISDLLYNLDARSTKVHVTPKLDELYGYTDNAKARENDVAPVRGADETYPFMREFWKSLGPRGNMTIYDRGWYFSAMQRLVYRDRNFLTRNQKKAADLSAARSSQELARYYLEAIGDFERQLVSDGYLVIKFFIHISQKEQARRLKDLLEDKQLCWHTSKADLTRNREYPKIYKVFDRLLGETDYDYAPWVLLNGEDKRSTNLSIVQTIVDALEDACAHRCDSVTASASSSPIVLTSRFDSVDNPPVIDKIDHTLVLSEDEYRSALDSEQKKLKRLQFDLVCRKIPLMIAYEGWDAAGKGGNIKRVAQALDARNYRVVPSPAPTPDELAHPFLWRYWTRLPRAGDVAIYDRTWYGRVLVERVEGLAQPDEWARAYDEINEFERELIAWGAILFKFWVNVSPEEQLRRFKERAADPEKQWKITDDDWRNREKYPLYKEAADDMFRLTSTPRAPWTIIESDNKYYARVKALRLINGAIEARLVF